MTVTPPRIDNPLRVTRLPQELVDSPTFLLKRLGYAAKEQAMGAYEETGLHPYHHAILIVLGEGSPETQGSIADTLGYDRGQLVGLLDELEERGLVERRRDPHDRRRHLVRLTPDGKRTLSRMRMIARRSEEEFLDPLSEKERSTLHALLFRLAKKHEPRCANAVPRTSK
ncbi:MAG: winged helix-turn-helix transcriptional regulator [Actinobacteria bacterium]|nr:MAG: winged helix-turn-helix transcriptional regulator [Actinomycetota bacterium]